MKIINKFKEYFMNNGYKKIIYNLLVIVIICTIALIAWDTFFPPRINNTEIQTDKNDLNNEVALMTTYQDSAEVQLKKILSEIKGVGEVEVMVTYESSTEVVPALNVTKSSQVTEEKDSQGGIRTTSQDDLSQNIVTTNQNNQLIVIKEIKPLIKGVVVVAQGAGDIKVKTELIEAVRTIFQIPACKVMVYEKK